MLGAIFHGGGGALVVIGHRLRRIGHPIAVLRTIGAQIGQTRQQIGPDRLDFRAAHVQAIIHPLHPLLGNLHQIGIANPAQTVTEVIFGQKEQSRNLGQIKVLKLQIRQIRHDLPPRRPRRAQTDRHARGRWLGQAKLLHRAKKDGGILGVIA